MKIDKGDYTHKDGQRGLHPQDRQRGTTPTRQMEETTPMRQMEGTMPTETKDDKEGMMVHERMKSSG